ncbi:carbohydrate ABC transporter permease [Clostridium formicaceticum]|uniref:L-arabinose transport system permease protein AraP n=1 Tax=Clostridium formicaceticum TaxID=1497 RepID=A0AAC9RNZ6_9CLOT|nr:sugar ABC transporter permease [Clostridium formicaceticum]AOY78032.1 sugar ABC transporter permease [Clostridium formicaceticum]ARE88668.1 L-arabinose transport system permease protein AraP [Clostridium formicaceticum]
MKMNLTRRGTLFVFLFPSLAGFLLFYILPFLGCGWYSLVDSSIGGRFVGLKNYVDILSNDLFLMALANTAYFVLLAVPATMFLGLLLAIVLNQKIYGSHIFRTAFVVPMVIPTASVVLIWDILFHTQGTFNALLTSLGFNLIDWLNSDKARIVMVLLYGWKNVGYCMVIFLGGLLRIPKEYYEAAELDGAGVIYKLMHITLPYLAPISFFVVVISIINSFKIFREVYLLAGPYPHKSIYTMQHYMNNVFVSLDYQKLSAAAYVVAGVLGILIYALFRWENKYSSIHK